MRLARLAIAAITIVIGSRAPAIGQLPLDRSLPESRLAALHRPLRGPRTLFRWPGQDRAEEPGPLRGPPDTIETDRPDFTEASSAVGLGVRQLEMGYTFYESRFDGVDTRSQTYPELLARWGLLANWFEVRMAWSAEQQTTDFGPPLARATDVGSNDLYLGAKIWLTEQSGWLPEMSIMPQTDVPTGSEEFGADEMLPGISWLYGWDISEWLSFGAQTQVNREQDPTGRHYAEFAQSATINYQFTDRFGGFTEYFGLYPTGASDSSVLPQHYFDGGFRYLLTADLQLDIRAGVGLNEAADDFFTGAGVSVRF